MAHPVLYLQGTTSFGGSKLSLLASVAVLPQIGYAPFVLCGRTGWLTERLSSDGTPLAIVPFPGWRKLLRRPFFNFILRRHWTRWISEWSPVIVHSNEFWWTPHALRVGRLFRIPVVVHLRSDLHDLNQARQYRLRQADAVLAVSSELREKFAADPELYEKTRVLHNGLDESQLGHDAERREWRRRLNLAPGEIAIAQIGKLCDNKNQRLLIGAMNRVKQQQQSCARRFKIFLAGTAEAAYKKSLEEQVAAYNLTSDTIFIGAVTEIGRFLAAMDLVVHCSKKEGFPRVVAEAMMAGKVVVATPSGGVRDAIPDETYGSVVDGEEEALAGEIVRFMSQEQMRETVAQAARKRARSMFTLDRFKEKLQGVYDQCLAEHSRGH